MLCLNIFPMPRAKIQQNAAINESETERFFTFVTPFFFASDV